MNKTIAATIATAYLASILAANYAIAHIGQAHAFGPHTLPVWPGLDAPSGVYVVGVTLVLRDVVQRQLGKLPTFALILAGAGLTALFSPSLAFASAAAFLIAETVDFGVFSLTEKRGGFIPAVAASNAVSLVVDSIVFLWLAFGSLAFVEGQIVGKLWATLAGVAILAAIHARRESVTA